MGETWTTADGTALTTPITDVAGPARIRDCSSNADPADNALVYIHDTTADADGHPVILYLTTKSYQPARKAIPAPGGSHDGPAQNGFSTPSPPPPTTTTPALSRSRGTASGRSSVRSVPQATKSGSHPTA